MQPAGAGDINRVRGVSAGVLVTAAPTNSLVAAGAERPAAVLRGRPVASQQHHSDVGRHSCMVEHPVQLVDGVRAKCVAHFRAVERHPHRGIVDVAVVGDVGQIVEPVHEPPRLGIKGLSLKAVELRPCSPAGATTAI